MCRDKGQIAVKGFSVRYRSTGGGLPPRHGRDQQLRRARAARVLHVPDTNGVQNFDKERVIQALQQAAEKLRDKVIL